MVLRRIAATINRPCLIETQKSPLAALAYMVAVRPASQTLLSPDPDHGSICVRPGRG